MRKFIVILLFISLNTTFFSYKLDRIVTNKVDKVDKVKQQERIVVSSFTEKQTTTSSVEFIPILAKQYLPYLDLIIEKKWPKFEPKSIMAGQIEQETCPSLKHSDCWNPKAEFKSSVEYGVGLGQITIAYDSNGNIRFNNFEEVKKIDKHLEKWEWGNRYDPLLQMEALVSKNRYNYNLMKGWEANHTNKLAFTMCAYNGGFGGLLKDRELCKTKSGCNPNIWFGNVEKYSYKAKTATSYSKSFYQINREYVSNILNIRHKKYITYLGS